jgi:hypothetical protein
MDENSCIILIEGCSHKWHSPSDLVEERMLVANLKIFLRGSMSMTKKEEREEVSFS